MDTKKRKKRRVMNEINVVPYIDVMLVLLVIFMVTAPMISPAVIDLPSVSQADRTQKVPPIQIILSEDGSLALEDKANHISGSVSKNEMTDYLRLAQQQNPNQPVVIAADKNIRYEAVIRLMDQLRQQHIDKIGLLVQPDAS